MKKGTITGGSGFLHQWARRSPGACQLCASCSHCFIRTHVLLTLLDFFVVVVFKRAHHRIWFRLKVKMAAVVNYSPPWWVNLLHRLPHFNLRFEQISSEFQPEDSSYQQVRAAARTHARMPHSLTGFHCSTYWTDCCFQEGCKILLHPPWNKPPWKSLSCPLRRWRHQILTALHVNNASVCIQGMWTPHHHHHAWLSFSSNPFQT